MCLELVKSLFLTLADHFENDRDDDDPGRFVDLCMVPILKQVTSSMYNVIVRDVKIILTIFILKNVKCEMRHIRTALK